MLDTLRLQMVKRLEDMRAEAVKMEGNLNALRGAIWDTDYWLGELPKLATPPVETGASPDASSDPSTPV